MADDEIDEELLLGLKQAKTKRQYFVAILKGSADGVLMLGKRKISPTDIADAKKKMGGSTIIRGACFGEDGRHVFETIKEPPASLPRVLKLIARRDAGLIINPICRVGTDPDLADGDEAAAPGAATAAPGTTPAPPAPSAAKAQPVRNDLALQWQQRVAALNDPLKRVLQEKLGDTAYITQQFKQAQTFAAGQKYPSALNVLKEVEGLVQAALAAGTVPKPSDADALAAWEDRLADLKDSLKLIPAQSPEMAEIRPRVQQAVQLAAAKKYDQAHALLNEVDQLIEDFQFQAKQADIKASTKDGTVAFRKALLRWERAIKDVTAEVTRLQKELPSKHPDQADLAPELKKILEELEFGDGVDDFGLSEALKDGISATSDAARQSANLAALGKINQFQNKARSIELIEIADACTFTKVRIQDTLSAALGELKSHLKA